jgi:hypothetical protein
MAFTESPESRGAFLNSLRSSDLNGVVVLVTDDQDGGADPDFFWNLLPEMARASNTNTIFNILIVVDPFAEVSYMDSVNMFLLDHIPSVYNVSLVIVSPDNHRLQKPNSVNDTLTWMVDELSRIFSVTNQGENVTVTRNSGLNLMDSSRVNKKMVCFITTAFGENASFVDNIPNRTIAHPSLSQDESTFGFFVFTNLRDLPSPGWEHLYYPQDMSTFPNNIVASRYGKFLAWEVPVIDQNCRAVFYVDGGWLLAKTADFWTLQADALVESEVGLMQYSHMWSKGLLHELKLIVTNFKDTRAHVKRERKWLLQQPDFKTDIPMYCNMAFGYNPSSPVYRELSTSFWNHYFYDGKGSWRDQPAWNYLLHHKKLKPLYFGEWPHDFAIWRFQNMTGRDPVWQKAGAMGFDGHRYVPRNRKKTKKET